MDRKEQLKQLLGKTNALLEAMRYSAGTASGEHANLGKYGSFEIFLRKYNALVGGAAPLLASPTALSKIDMGHVRGSGDYTWPQQKQWFDLAYSNAAILKATLEGEIGYAEDETHKLKDFIQGNLRRVIFTTPQKEVDIQNAIEALIVGRGMARGADFDRETGRVKTSGKESIPDFIFPLLKLCLEVKLSKSPDKLRAIVDEMNADIRAYTTKYERQLYVVYDVGTIQDEAEFKRGLENAPGVSVVVVKH